MVMIQTLLKMKVQKPNGANRSAAVQHRQGSLIENSSATIGQATGKAPLPQVKGPRFMAPRNAGAKK